MRGWRRRHALECAGMIRNAPELVTTWAQTCLLLDGLICPQQDRLRDRQAEGLGGLQVDDQLELCWLLDGQIGGLRTPEDLVDEDRRAPPDVRKINSVGKQTPGFAILPEADARQ